MKRFDVKLPSESNVLTFDMSLGLTLGNLLTGTPLVTISVYTGTDPTPTAILNGSAQLDTSSKLILVPVQGGLDLVDYLINVWCATVNSNIGLSLNGVLPVRAKQ